MGTNLSAQGLQAVKGLEIGKITIQEVDGPESTIIIGSKGSGSGGKALHRK
jgi:hypothetical protein